MGHVWHSRFVFCLAMVAIAVTVSCEPPRPVEDSTEPPFIELGDIAEIAARGQLRILVPLRPEATHLPRRGYSFDFERELVEDFASALGVEAVFVNVEARDALIPSLLEGRGDVIVANFTATRQRKKQVDFTVPVHVVREHLVCRRQDDTIRTTADLEGRTIALRRSSSFWRTVVELIRQHPGIAIEAVSERLDTEELIHRVAMGEHDLTVADSNLLAAALQYRDDVKSALTLTGDRPIGWAVRKSSVELLDRLNRYLHEAKLAERLDVRQTGDLDNLKRQSRLRLITRNGFATYFLWRGQLVGFEYDLVQEFARRHGLTLEVIVPPSGDELLPWLVEGRGDIVAATVSRREARAVEGVAASTPYHYASQVVVSRADDPSVQSARDLRGRTVHVRRGSSAWEALKNLRAHGIEFEIRAVPDHLETEDTIDLVSRGQYDLTVAGSHLLNVERRWRDHVRGAFTLEEDKPLVWAVRMSNPLLEHAVNEFIRSTYRGVFYNVTYKKYFEDHRRIRDLVAQRLDLTAGFTPYDEIIKRYSDRYGFDWRLIASQMYEESRFQPRAVSFAGARGLMQVLPNTAEEFGFSDLEDPEEGIHAGVRYLDWLRERFEDDLSVQDRMWFSLAGYNAGLGHVRDARRLAEQQGLNPNRWFDNVERAMALLSLPEYAEVSRHGYCRCNEPVDYVREIRSRYNAYVDAFESAALQAIPVGHAGS